MGCSRNAGTQPKGETVKLTTIDTPDGPFTLLVDSRVVVASGWTDAAEAIVARLRPTDRPGTLDAVSPDDPELAFAVDAVRAYYAGDLEAVKIGRRTVVINPCKNFTAKRCEKFLGCRALSRCTAKP